MLQLLLAMSITSSSSLSRLLLHVFAALMGINGVEMTKYILGIALQHFGETIELDLHQMQMQKNPAGKGQTSMGKKRATVRRPSEAEEEEEAEEEAPEVDVEMVIDEQHFWMDCHDARWALDLCRRVEGILEASRPRFHWQICEDYRDEEMDVIPTEDCCACGGGELTETAPVPTQQLEDSPSRSPSWSAEVDMKTETDIESFYCWKSSCLEQSAVKTASRSKSHQLKRSITAVASVKCVFT